MGIIGNIIQTTPATVKAYIVTCEQDKPDGSFSFYFEPVIAWMHEIDSGLSQTGDSQCYPVTAVHGAVLEEYAVFFPDSGSWHVHCYEQDGERVLVSEGRERLEKYLAERFKQRKLHAVKVADSKLDGFSL